MHTLGFSDYFMFALVTPLACWQPVCELDLLGAMGAAIPWHIPVLGQGAPHSLHVLFHSENQDWLHRGQLGNAPPIGATART